MKKTHLAALLLAIQLGSFSPSCFAEDAQSELTPEQRLAQLEAELEKNPNKLDVKFKVGLYLIQHGYEGLGEEQFNEIGKINPDFVLKQLEAFLQKRFYTECEALMVYCRKRYPNAPAVFLVEAKRARRMGHPEDSTPLYEKACSAGPRWNEACDELAEYFAERLKWSDAMRVAQKALQNNNADMRALSVKVRAQVAQGVALRKLKNEILRIHRADPLDPEISLMLARIYMGEGKNKEALEPALHAFMRPNTPQLAVTTTETLKTLIGELPEPDVNKAILNVTANYLDNRDMFLLSFFRLRLGELFASMDRHETAQRYLVQALSNRMFASQVNTALAREVEAHQRDHRTAMYFYNMAFQYRPSDPQTIVAMKRFKKRWMNYRNDLSWRLKDAVRGAREAIPPVPGAAARVSETQRSAR